MINKGTTGNPAVMQELRMLFWLSAIHNFHISAVYLERRSNCLADSAWRLHEPNHLRFFYAALTTTLPPDFVAYMLLEKHMSPSRRFLLSRTIVHAPRCPIGPWDSSYRAQLFADSTKITYEKHRDTYLRFCYYMGYPPAPVDQSHLLQYAAFLARSLKPSSIRGYLNIIGILHKEFGFPNPLLDNWPLKSLLTGKNRALGSPPNQKEPITPAILLRLHSCPNFTSSFDASFWAICLVAFFGMFRKSHLLPKLASNFNPAHQITRSDSTKAPPNYPRHQPQGLLQPLISQGGCLFRLPVGNSDRAHQGARRSDAVLMYLTMPLSIRLQSANLMGKSIKSHIPPPSTTT